MNSIVTRWTIVAFMIGAAIFGFLGYAAWAIQQDKINQLQQERNELLNRLETTLTLQQSIIIDTKAQEVIPSMSAEVSFAFSTEFKGGLVDTRERLIVILFDAKGQEIDRIPDGRIMRVDPVYQRVYLFSLDARYLPPGVYILVISAEYPVQISAMHPAKEETVGGSAVVTILRQ